MTTPVFALTFANDHDPQGRYLPSLAEELRGVRQALDDGATARWQVVERANTTIDDLLDVFDAHRGSVVALHYGGHAAGYGLLLQSVEGHPRLANASGLARFLGTQSSLRLVFLNGCSTLGQVRELLDAGVPAVIATEREIEDAIATRFSTRFYKALAGGMALQAAFEQARGAVESDGKALGTSRGLDTTDEAAPAPTTFAWTLHTADGAEHVARWHIGLVTGDPLFGLPPLPPADLPTEPFRHLQWFAPEHAAVFFGRGQEIRTLYDRLVQPAPPITLLFGQAGAGKSSLLAAGVLPRLRATHLVAYLRRDEALGLPAALRKALGIAPGAPLPPDAWRALEAKLGKPVVIILDQLEEAFTKPMPIDAAPPPAPAAPSSPAADAELQALYGIAAAPAQAVPVAHDELGLLVADLVTLFRDVAGRPNGRLVLSFRKEWLAEVRARLVEARLPLAEVFLDRLGRDGIVEAVSGPARDPALRAQYHLDLEPGFADVIADDLLVDPSAPVAPTLQVLLAKLWQAATPARDGTRRFDRALYQPLKDAGILLGDFLDQQLAALGTTHAEAVATGLALDVLAMHTTAHRTAGTRTRAELLATYPQAAAVLPALLQRLVDLYVLAVPDADTPDTTRLAHDTLASIVRDRMDASDLPAQRARRILEGRAVEWKGGEEGRLLDDVDVTAVEAGLTGMRAPTPDETRLIEQSRVAARMRFAERKIAEALSAEDPLVAALRLGELSGYEEPLEGLHAASRIARRPIPLSIIDLPQSDDGSRSRALHVAAHVHDDHAVPIAVGTKWIARLPWLGAPGERYTLAWPGDGDPVTISRNMVSVMDRSGRRVVAGGNSWLMLMWTWSDPVQADFLVIAEEHERYAPMPDAEGRQHFVAPVMFDDAGERLVSSATNGEIAVWRVADGARIALVPAADMQRGAIAPDGAWLITGIYGGASTLHALGPDGITSSRPFADAERSAVAFTFNASSTLVCAEGKRGPLHLWSLQAIDDGPRPFEGSESAICYRFNPGYYQIVAGCRDGTLRDWFYDSPLRPEVRHAHDRPVRSLTFSDDGTLLVSTADDGSAKLWEMPNFVPLGSLGGHRGLIRSVAIDPDATWVATVGDGEGDAIRVWSAEGATEPVFLRRHSRLEANAVYEGEDGARRIVVSADGSHFAIAAPDGTVRVTALEGARETITVRHRDDTQTAPWSIALGMCGSVVTVMLSNGMIARGDVAPDAPVVPGVRAAASGRYETAAMSQDGRWVAYAIGDVSEPGVWLVTTEGGAERRLWAGENAYAIAFSADSQLIAINTESEGLRVWSLGTEPTEVLHAAEGWGPAVFSRDGAYLATRVQNAYAVYATDGSGPPAMVPVNGATMEAITFTADGDFLLIGMEDGGIVTASIASGEPGDEAAAHTGPVSHLEVSADGTGVLSVSEDGAAMYWQLGTDARALLLVAGRERVERAVFTPDSRRVITRDEDGYVRIWSVSWNDLVQRVQEAAAAATAG